MQQLVHCIAFEALAQKLAPQRCVLLLQRLQTRILQQRTQAPRPAAKVVVSTADVEASSSPEVGHDYNKVSAMIGWLEHRADATNNKSGGQQAEAAEALEVVPEQQQRPKKSICARGICRWGRQSNNLGFVLKFRKTSTEMLCR